MIMPFFHPSHNWQRANLPPFPAVSGPSIAYACKCCGLLGFRRDGDPHIHITNRKDMERARLCDPSAKPAVKAYALITSENLTKRAANLLAGTKHALIHAPTQHGSTSDVWVKGPDGPVPVNIQEFTPVSVRQRVRVQHAS